MRFIARQVLPALRTFKSQFLHNVSIYGPKPLIFKIISSWVFIHEPVRNRSFEVLQMATALHLGAKEFLTFDANQQKLASAEKLKVKP
jgi:hypothetical protein